MRKCKKAGALKILLPSNTCSTQSPLVNASPAFIYDLIASIVGTSVHPERYEAVAWQIISYIPTGCKRVDLVADSYSDSSIKSNTRLS